MLDLHPFGIDYLEVKPIQAWNDADFKKLFDALASEHETVRLVAAGALGQIGADAAEALKPLESVMEQDESGWVQHTAEEAYWEIRDALEGR